MVNQLDVPSIFLAAQQAKSNALGNLLTEKKISALGAGSERQDRLAEALPGAFSGKEDDLQTVQTLSPEFALDLTKEQRLQAESRSNMILGFAVAAKRNPDQRAAIRQQAINELGLENIPEEFDDASLDSIIGQASNASALFNSLNTLENVQRVTLTGENGETRNAVIGIQGGQIVIAGPNGRFAPATEGEASQISSQIQRTQELPPASQIDPAQETSDGGFVPENVDVSEATGGSGFVGNLLNKVSDLFGAGLPFPEVAEGTEVLNDLSVATKTTLQDAVPGRPSNFLLEQFEKLEVKPNSLFTGDETAKTRFTQQRRFIEQAIQTLDGVLAEPTISKSDRSKSTIKRNQLFALLQSYDQVIRNIDSQDDKPPIESFFKDQ